MILNTNICGWWGVFTDFVTILLEIFETFKEKPCSALLLKNNFEILNDKNFNFLFQFECTYFVPRERINIRS